MRMCLIVNRDRLFQEVQFHLFILQTVGVLKEQIMVLLLKDIFSKRLFDFWDI